MEEFESKRQKEEIKIAIKLLSDHCPSEFGMYEPISSCVDGGIDCMNCWRIAFEKDEKDIDSK